MSTKHGRLPWTLMLLFVAGVLCNMWTVEHQGRHICAVKGSSVVIQCSFHHPEGLRVKRVRWGHVRSRHLSGRVVFDSSFGKSATRFQYIGDKHHSCALKIHQVTQNDAGRYMITFNNYKIDTWRGNGGPTLKVVDLKILVTKTNGNGTMKEGDSANLTCVNRCDGHDLSSAFTWFKNGKPISEGRVLSLNNISYARSGNYTCSLKTQTATTSGAINIDVEYGPKNTSVSVSPSTETEVDSNFTLTCSSHSNPPVENYTWFKLDDDVKEVEHRPVYLPADQGWYLCSVTNKHGTQNSSVVNLKMKSHQGTFSSDVFIIVSAVVALLLSISMVIAIRRFNKSMLSPKTDCEKDTEKSDYVNWSVVDKSQLQMEKNQCEQGSAEPIYATLKFNEMGKSNMGQQIYSGEDVIYSTVCH